MAIDKLIQTVMMKEFEKTLKDAQVLNKLSATRYESALTFGDELSVLLPGRVTLNDWTGGDLSAPEKVTASEVKVKADIGVNVNFEIDEAKEAQIMKAKGADQMALAKEYASDAVYKYANKLDQLIGGLYPVAGHVIDNSGSAITVSTSNAATLLAQMAAKFKAKGNKDASSWVEGKMCAVISPEYEYYLINSSLYQNNTETGVKEIKKGSIGKLFGWDIFVSNNLGEDGSNNFYPMFGVMGETTASVAQSTINLIPYMRDESLNKAFKGKGIMGAGCGRPDKLGTIKCAAITL